MSASVKYHINPQKGPMKCEASSVDRCLYGRRGEPHFQDEDEAQNFWQNSLKKEYGTLSSHNGLRKQTHHSKKFDDILESYDMDSLRNFVNSDRNNYNLAYENLRGRYSEWKQRTDKLKSISPFVDGNKNPCDFVTFKSLLRDTQSFADKTNLLADACYRSKFAGANFSLPIQSN